MNANYEKLLKCTEIVKGKIGDFKPQIAVVLGSGLNEYADKIEVVKTVGYEEIESFPVSTVVGHVGRFVFGYANGVPVVIMQGRVHYYEGYSMSDVILPIRLMGLLGAEVFFATNGVGAVNRGFKDGDLMLIRDHLSLFVPSPLIGENIDELGTRFPDMTDLYRKDLRAIIRNTADELGINLKEGTYVMLTGPQYETPEEIRVLEKLGGDVVGMSTVVETIAANHMGMKVCGISWVGNMGAGINDEVLEHVMRDGIDNKFVKLVSASIENIAKTL